MADVFWMENPSVLFAEPDFVPRADMPKAQKLNILTRLAIIASGLMYFMGYDFWLTFLLSSVVIIALVYYSTNPKEDQSRENFTIVPTHIGDDFSQTVVAPLFAEEQRVPPPAYDLYTNVDFIPTTFEEPMRPQSYPYGQYLTNTNLLPSDEYYMRMNKDGGAKTAREYVNSTWTKNSLAFRENMTRIYKRKLNRRFRHNTNDTFSPFNSY